MPEAARTTVPSMSDHLLDHPRLVHRPFDVSDHRVAVARASEPVLGPVDG